MADETVHIHLPNRIKRKSFKRLPNFYTLLETVLRARGVRVEKHGQNAYLHEDFNGLRNITYHTRIAKPDWLNIKGSYLKEFFHVDPEGYAGFSSIRHKSFDPDTVDADQAAAFHGKLRRFYIKHQRTKYGKFDVPWEDLPSGSIAIFLQKQDDVTVDLAHMSTQDMIRTVLANRGSHPVVLKRHPWCQNPAVGEMLLELASHEDGIFVTSANVHDVVSNAHRVVAINSGAAFEALLHLKPVTLFGRSDYHAAVQTCTDFTQSTRAFEPTDFSPDYIQKFLFWYLGQNLVSPKFCDAEAQLNSIFNALGWGQT